MCNLFRNHGHAPTLVPQKLPPETRGTLAKKSFHWITDLSNDPSSAASTSSRQRPMSSGIRHASSEDQRDG
jgi:hypothetical protein